MERAELIAALREFAGPALVERDGACFLVDPNWGERERAQWVALAERRPENPDDGRGWLCVPTGGSSGAMKLARHDEHTIGAAVRGFAEHFGVNRVDAIGLLPAWHVSGLMAWARCRFTGGTYRVWRWKCVERGERPEPARSGGEFLSLVPTQLARLLGDATSEAWLREFRAVLIGGGPAWPELRTKAREARLPLAFSYGMTETAALVAAQLPEEFLAGDDTSGRALPHARLRTAADGRLEIEAASLFYGYWPGTRATGGWRTDDLGAIDAAGRLTVRGRADALIISGGEKVNPTEVEAALRTAGGAELADVAVVGLPHPDWGSEVVALYVGEVGLEPKLRAELARILAPSKRPKRYLPVAVADWPRDARGKLNRAILADLAVRLGGV
jgi:Acyl-CoA synthetases (AMP-forming)/AMP-acid ligases II